MMNESKITVTKKGVKRAQNGHLWIYKSDLINPDAIGGTVVSVFDERKNFVAKAFYSDKSEISLRIITLKNEKIDREFWRTRIVDAATRRHADTPKRKSEPPALVGGFSDINNQPSPPKEESQIPNPKSQIGAERLIFSEGDLISSLIVDCYADVFVLQTLSQGTDALKQTFVEILREEFSPRAIIERNDVKVRQLEGLPLQTGFLDGECDDEIIIEQDGVKFYVSPLGGQKTGAFLDQRENRFALRNYAFGNALDCFTFNGGFALNLAQTCESVLALDISEEAVNLANRNAKLNEIKNVKFEVANVFDKLRDLEESRRKFDTIVLDPPAFAKNRGSVKAAMRGYKEINLRALKLLNKGGILATCSCSYHLHEAQLVEIVEEAARDAKRRVQLIEKRAQSSDHPILLGMPETHYLKCLILRVLD